MRDLIFIFLICFELSDGQTIFTMLIHIILFMESVVQDVQDFKHYIFVRNYGISAIKRTELKIFKRNERISRISRKNMNFHYFYQICFVYYLFMSYFISKRTLLGFDQNLRINLYFFNKYCYCCNINHRLLLKLIILARIGLLV